MTRKGTPMADVVAEVDRRKGVSETDYNAPDSLTAEAREQAFEFYRYLAKRDGATCEVCLAHPSSLVSVKRQRATHYRVVEWNGRLEQEYCCAEHVRGDEWRLL